MHVRHYTGQRVLRRANMQIFLSLSGLSHLSASDYFSFVIFVIKSIGLTSPVGLHTIMQCFNDKLVIHVPCETKGEYS